MAKLVNRARMTTATTGTGTITLGSAVTGYQSFAGAGVANAEIVSYLILDGAAWEIGTGTYTSSGTTLSRTVTESSNADSALNLSGNAHVMVTARAEDFQDRVPYGTQMIPIPAASCVARTTNGAASYSTELATNDIMLTGYEFSAATEQAIQTSFVVPKQIDEGATMTARFHWTVASGGAANDVIWGIRARAASNDDAMDGTWGTAVTVTDTWIANNDNHITSLTSAMTVGNTLAEGDKLFLEFYRDADAGGDTLGTTAILTDIELFITTNSGHDG
jgi:hypothetical protein